MFILVIRYSKIILYINLFLCNIIKLKKVLILVMLVSEKKFLYWFRLIDVIFYKLLYKYILFFLKKYLYFIFVKIVVKRYYNFSLLKFSGVCVKIFLS